MKVLVDTNVILDVLLDRKPFAEPAAALLALIERREVTGLLCATTVTTVAYLAGKAVGAARARRQIHALLTLFEVAPVDTDILRRAAAPTKGDFEDLVLFEAAVSAGAEAVVTRDPKGYKGKRLPALSPAEALTLARRLEAPRPL